MARPGRSAAGDYNTPQKNPVGSKSGQGVEEAFSIVGHGG